MKDQTLSWQQIGAARQAETLSKIPEAWRLPQHLFAKKSFLKLPQLSGILSESELAITEKRGVDIVSLIQKGQLTSVEVAIAFCKRAAIAHQAVGDNRLQVSDPQLISFHNIRQIASQKSCLRKP